MKRTDSCHLGALTAICGLKVVEGCSLQKGWSIMEKRYYIAYGSNLNLRQMKMRCPTAKVMGTVVLCQEKVQIKYNQFSLCLAKLNLLFLSHFLLDFSDILPHIGLGINTRNGCEYVLYCKMFLCIQKSTYMHVYN